MKGIIIGVLSIISIATFAQNQRFVYEYKFASDSTKMNETQSEIMHLDTSKKGSKFYSQKKEVADSIQLDRVKKQSKDFSGIDYGSVLYVVEKSYPDYKIHFFNSLEIDKFKVSDHRKMEWIISSDKEKMGDFNAQKATLQFAGRYWTAWFVADIPLQDGPYKFHGLPGLIIKIEDQNKSHSFVLKAIKNLSADQEWKSDGEKKNFAKIIEIDQEKYKKQLIDFRNNPAKSFRQLMSGNSNIRMVDEKGNILDIEKIIKDKERAAKENNARDNNLLELDLLQ